MVIVIDHSSGLTNTGQLFQGEGFADLDRLALELREISKKLRWIDRRLSKDFIDDKERQKLLSLKSRYVRLSQKLLNALSKSVNLYADRKSFFP